MRRRLLFVNVRGDFGKPAARQATVYSSVPFNTTNSVTIAFDSFGLNTTRNGNIFAPASIVPLYEFRRNSRIGGSRRATHVAAFHSRPTYGTPPAPGCRTRTKGRMASASRA